MSIQINEEEKLRNEKRINFLKNKLIKVEAELKKVRDCSPLKDGWQTSNYARKSRKYDHYAEEKRNIVDELYFEYGIEI